MRNEQVCIVEVRDIRVAALEHRGDPAHICDQIRRFIDWRRENGLTPKVSATFTILYDDPDTTPPPTFGSICAPRLSATSRRTMPGSS